MTNWREELKEAFEANGDDFSKMKTTLTESDLNIEFDSESATESGKPFTAWGEEYVYFPICYEGSEWVGSAPRNPCDEATSHQGR